MQSHDLAIRNSCADESGVSGNGALWVTETAMSVVQSSPRGEKMPLDDKAVLTLFLKCVMLIKTKNHISILVALRGSVCHAPEAAATGKWKQVEGGCESPESETDAGLPVCHGEHKDNEKREQVEGGCESPESVTDAGLPANRNARGGVRQGRARWWRNCLEWPTDNPLWSDPRHIHMEEQLQMIRVDIHGCALGLVAQREGWHKGVEIKGLPILKPWTISATSIVL